MGQRNKPRRPAVTKKIDPFEGVTPEDKSSLEFTWLKTLKDRLDRQTHELAEAIRVYCREQREWWQRVPYLALQADGRDGFDGRSRAAYTTGYWALLHMEKHQYNDVDVDLATGELVHAYDHPKSAGDEAVLLLAAKLQELDAVALVQELTKESKEPISPYMKDTNPPGWREEELEKLGLEPVYTRKK